MRINVEPPHYSVKAKCSKSSPKPASHNNNDDDVLGARIVVCDAKNFGAILLSNSIARDCQLAQITRII